MHKYEIKIMNCDCFVMFYVIIDHRGLKNCQKKIFYQRIKKEKT